MNKEIERLGYYIKTFDRDIFITKDQRSILFEAMDNQKLYFDINDSRIMMRQIKEVIPASEYAKSVTGGYYCPKHPKNFVPKGKVCGYC